MAKKNLIRMLIFLAGIVICLEIVGYGLEIFSLSRRSREDLVASKARKSLKEVQEANALLVNRIKSLSPKGIYIVIDTAENRLYVMNGPNVAKEVVVSCGSGDILQEPGGARKWIFDTPRGEFSVSSKLVNPTWIKPDWAFIEEGEKPPQDYNKRIDNDSLGEYALGFGDGYFIHGTLYTRLLGRNVTHGCVRVGDKDLKEVFQAVMMGAKIFIF
ncbi:MAG: L,D-transpeptidase [Candidatus Aminicenantales bacterium]